MAHTPSPDRRGESGGETIESCNKLVALLEPLQASCSSVLVRSQFLNPNLLEWLRGRCLCSIGLDDVDM